MLKKKSKQDMLKNLFSSPVASFLAANSVINQQVRTAFVLKRKYEVPLKKKNERQMKLKGRHFVYELVKDTNTEKKKDVEVVLTTYVEGLGKKGDIISTKPLFAYNKLLLPGYAVYSTPANVEKYSRSADESNDDIQYSSQFSKRTKDVLERRVIAVVMNKDHPWVVEPWHIRASLRKGGFHVLKDSQIELPAEKISGPDLTIQNKEFYVYVTINNLERAKVKCRIHHWSTDPSNRVPYVFQHWFQPAEPLFGTDIQPQGDTKPNN